MTGEDMDSDRSGCALTRRGDLQLSVYSYIGGMETQYISLKSVVVLRSSPYRRARGEHARSLMVAAM